MLNELDFLQPLADNVNVETGWQKIYLMRCMNIGNRSSIRKYTKNVTNSSMYNGTLLSSGIYLVYLGVCEGQCLMMFGKSSTFKTRLAEHRRKYSAMKIILMVKYTNERVIENELREF